MKKKRLKYPSINNPRQIFINLITSKKYGDAYSELITGDPELAKENPVEFNKIPSLVSKWLPEKKDLIEYVKFLNELFSRKDRHLAFKLAYGLAEKFPEEFDVNEIMGLFCLKLGLNDFAEKYLKKAIEINPNISEVNSNFGNVLKNKGNFEDAKYYYLKAADLDPNNYIAINNVASVCKLMGDLVNYKYFVKKALDICPKYLTALANYAMYLIENNENKKEQKRIIEQIKSIDANSKYIPLLEYQQKISKNANGEEEFKKYLLKCKEVGEFPPTPMLSFEGREALKNHERFIDNQYKEGKIPEWKYFYEKGNARLENAEFTEAKKLIEKSIQLNPSNTESKITLISILVVNNEINEARIEINKSKYLLDYSPKLRCLLALIEVRESNLEKAKTILLEVLRYDAEHFLGNLLLGVVYFREKEYRKAKEFITKILYKDDAIVDYFYGKVLYESGEYLNAIKFLKKFIKYLKRVKFEKEDILLSAIYYIAHAYLSIQKMTKSIKYFKIALKIKISHFILNDIAIAYAKRNNYISSERFLLKSLSIKSDYGKAKENLRILNGILPKQKKYYLLLFGLLVFSTGLLLLKKVTPGISILFVLIILLITKKLKPGISIALGEFKFSFALGDFDYNIDEKCLAWRLSVDKEELI